MPKTKVNWNSKDVLEIMKNQSLTIQQMSDKLGVSYSTVAHKRMEFGLERLRKVGLDHALTNKERKARYNAKIKQIGYKPLYTAKGKKYMKFKIEITTDSKDSTIKDKCLSAISEVLKKDGEYFSAGFATKEPRFRELSMPLVEYLRKHYHPHARIIIDYESAEIVEGVLVESFQKSIV